MTLDARVGVRWTLLVLVPLVLLLIASGRAPVAASVASAGLGGVVLAHSARRHPHWALTLATAVVVFVPYYDGRLVTRALALTPMGACCLVLLPAAWDARHRLRLGPLDAAVAVLVALRCLALLLNFVNGFGALFTVLLQIALPYVVFRCLLTDVEATRGLAQAVVGAAAVLSVFGIAEGVGSQNPFFTFLPSQYQASQWARPELRDGKVRAEASFGHPIAFGMFLAVALLLALAMALLVEDVWRRTLLLGAAGLIVLALTQTQSRGPLVSAVIGIVMWIVLSYRRLNAVRLLGVLAVVGVVVVATPVLGTVQRLVSASAQANSREDLSAQYRFEIFDVATDPAEFSLLGRRNEAGGVTAAVNRRTGLKSIDSEFALVYLTAGLLSLLAFLAVVVLVFRTAFVPLGSPLERAWVVALCASSLNLLTVALLTQEGELFWTWVALTAAIAQRQRSHQRVLVA